MREIGGYIELDKYNLPMLHEGAIALNCGRNALAYLIRAKQIKKIKIPKFLCATVKEVCEKENVAIGYYYISENFMPENISLDADEWLYVVNFYGQLTNQTIQLIADAYKRIIVDNAQAYFQEPVSDIDTLYTCRKFFGVPDGAFLYTNMQIDEELPQDESYDRMRFLLGRFERTASEFYSEYSNNNNFFTNQPIKKMSKLTDNLLHGLDYKMIQNVRTENFGFIHDRLGKINQLVLNIPQGAFMYPLYVSNGDKIRKKLQSMKIYSPVLWPDVFDVCMESDLEYHMAKNILLLPVDQRYGRSDMEYIVEKVENEL